VFEGPRFFLDLGPTDITYAVHVCHVIPMDEEMRHTREMKLVGVSACECGVRTESTSGPNGLIGWQFIHEEAL